MLQKKKKKKTAYSQNQRIAELFLAYKAQF